MPTVRAYSSVRKGKKDELVSFLEMGKASFKVIYSGLVDNASKRFVTPLTVSIEQWSFFIVASILL